jgi:abequosyltransferase
MEPMETETAVDLSICMPVYNCAEFVGDALASILGQLPPGVEIVVYDGGSTDDTASVVSRIAATSSAVRYHRATTRGGIDADLAACVGLARGRYCWLFSGDDVMRPAALSRALERIQGNRDVYVCEHTLCDRSMRRLSAYPVMAPNAALDADLRDPDSRRQWFARALNTEAFFSFMSSIIVRRTRWQAGRLLAEFDGSCWAHVARLFDLASAGLDVSYVAEVWLDKRGGNDSFSSSGVVARYSLAIDGFDRLSKSFFPADGAEAFHIRRVLRNEFGARALLEGKLLCAEQPERESRERLDRLIDVIYRDRTAGCALVRWVYRLTPLWTLRVARAAIRRLRSSPSLD